MEFEKIQEIIAESLSLEPSEVTMDKSFKEDLGADSLDSVQIIMKIEDEFDISVPDDAADNIKTVADVVAEIQKLVG